MPQQPTHWRVLMALFTLAGVIESLAYGHFGAFTPLYLRELRVPPQDIPFWTGMLGGVGFVIGLPLLPFWGVWAERYGRKLIIIRSSYISALLFAVAAFSQNVWMLLFARFLVGFVLGNTGVMLALQSETTPRAHLGMAVGLVSAGAPLGLALGPYLGSLVVDAAGIRALLLVDATLVGSVAVALTLLIHEPPRAAGPPAAVWAMLLATYRSIVHAPIISRLFVAYFLAGMGLMLAFPFVPLMVEQLYDGARPARMIGLILTVAGVAQALATPLWGRLGDRAGRLRVLIGCTLAGALAMAAQGLAADLPFFFAARVVFGVVQGAVGALTIALIAQHVADERRAAVLTLSLLPLQFAWFLGPVAGALLSPLGLPALFLVAALLMLLAAAPPVALRSLVAVRQQPVIGD